MSHSQQPFNSKKTQQKSDLNIEHIESLIKKSIEQFERKEIKVPAHINKDRFIELSRLYHYYTAWFNISINNKMIACNHPEKNANAKEEQSIDTLTRHYGSHYNSTSFYEQYKKDRSDLNQIEDWGKNIRELHIKSIYASNPELRWQTYRQENKKFIDEYNPISPTTENEKNKETPPLTTAEIEKRSDQNTKKDPSSPAASMKTEPSNKNFLEKRSLFSAPTPSSTSSTSSAPTPQRSGKIQEKAAELAQFYTAPHSKKSSGITEDLEKLRGTGNVKNKRDMLEKLAKEKGASIQNVLTEKINKQIEKVKSNLSPAMESETRKLAQEYIDKIISEVTDDLKKLQNGDITLKSPEKFNLEDAESMNRFLQLAFFHRAIILCNHLIAKMNFSSEMGHKEYSRNNPNEPIINRETLKMLATCMNYAEECRQNRQEINEIGNWGEEFRRSFVWTAYSMDPYAVWESFQNNHKAYIYHGDPSNRPVITVGENIGSHNSVPENSTLTAIVQKQAAAEVDKYKRNPRQ